MFRNQLPVTARRSLWAKESTPNCNTESEKRQRDVSFKRELNPIAAEDLISELRDRERTAELAVVKLSVDFVNAVINNNATKVNEGISNLVMTLKAFKESHPNETVGAFSFSTAYLSEQLATYSNSDYQFAAFYNASPIKNYLDSVCTRTQSPQKFNSSPSKR